LPLFSSKTTTQSRYGGGTFPTGLCGTKPERERKHAKETLVERITYIQQAANSARERDFIFHIAKTLEQVHNRNAKLGGLSERHLAHQSWPPIPKLVKGKVFPYSLPSVGPGADPSVQAVSPQVT